MEKVIDYLFDNYSAEDAEQLSKVPMVAQIAINFTDNFESKIDKIALFNGIEKK